MQRLREGPLVGRREVWIDGGHNPAAARSVAATIDKQFTDGRPMTLLFASLSNKDPVGMLKPFRGIVSEVMTLAIRDHDCRSPEELAHIARGLGFTARPAASLEAAMRNSAADNRTLVFGSLYLAGEALAANRETVD
jgi:dihydrofolate synthase/folylpolyglutamate synthase